MRWELWLGSLIAVLVALAGFYRWAHQRGVDDATAAQTQTALEVTQEALVLADEQGRIDTGLSLAASQGVQALRSDGEARREVRRQANLTPAGGDHALVCPDVLSGPFVRLYNGQAGGGDAPATPAPAAAGVPAGR